MSDKTINAYYNGAFSSIEDVRIPLCDRSVFFGDAIYDAAIGANGKIFMLDEHIDRFIGNAKTMNIPLLKTREELCSIFYELIKSTSYKSYFLYFQLSRFSPGRAHAYPDTEKSNLLVTLSPVTIPNPQRTLKLILREDKRYSFCNVKTVNLLPAVLASREAEELGADEAVFVRNGVITECAHSNVHIIRNGRLITHQLDEYILPGIARRHLLSVCERLGIPFEERDFGEDELFSADEILVTSSSKLCLRASSIEEKNLILDNESIGAKLCYATYDDFCRKTL